MRILVIDDERVFVSKTFLERGHEIVYAKTSAEGLKYLKQDWDEIYLDHDLGGTDTVRPCTYELERMAHDDSRWAAPHIIIHTANPTAKHSMRLGLENYAYSVVCVNAEDISLIKIEAGDYD